MESKLCQLCKKEFTPKRKTQKFCKREHTKECEVCGKVFRIKKLNSPAKTCSSSCASTLTHTDESKKKRKENSMKKYGTEFPFQAQEVKKKIKESLDNSENDMRIGSKNFKNTIKSKYGVENVSQLDSIKEKKKKSYVNKYGVINPMQSEEVVQKRKDLMLERHGVENKKYVNVKNKEDFMNLYSFLSKNSLDIDELCDYFNVKKDKMQREIREQDVVLLVKNYGESRSIKEDKFKEFLKEDFPNINVKVNDRTILKGKELDFYFPNHNLAVEISPTRTHNTISGYNGSPGVLPNYHKNKFLECDKKGIELITIFDWHDWNKILEMVSSKLKNNEKIYARKTVYVEENQITKEDIETFNDWHILNLPYNFKRKNKISKLIFNNEVVGLALWVNHNSYVELKRLAFKPNINVIGGASKLLKNYIKNNKPKEIMTYSDCDLGTGNVYKVLGFTLKEESKPQLNYYNPYHKHHIRNLSLVKQGADRLLRNLPNYKYVGKGENLPSNKEIIESYGFLPVYDCGYRKWKLKI